MCRSGQRPVVVIPGIGGHPRFHDGFVRALGHRHRVHSAPHADFTGEPCPDWEPHVRHWLGQFHTAARSTGAGSAAPGPPGAWAGTAAGAGDAPALVGISFGAHVAWDVWRRLPPGAASGLVLISYWPLTGWQRRGLTRLARWPRAGALAVGTACLRWSRWRAPDRDRLLRLRRELYDDEAAVRRRLFARLVSLAGAPPAPAEGAGARFVYARRELALRAMRRRYGGALPPGCTVVDGDHAVSLGGSAELAAAVDALLGQPTVPENGWRGNG